MALFAFFLPDFRGGGAERVALTVIQGLLRRGHAIDLVLCKADGVLLRDLPKGVRVVDLGAPKMRNALAPLVRYLRREQPSAIQASMWPLTAIAIAASRLAGAGSRVVVSEHSSLTSAYAGQGWLRRGLLNYSIRGLYPLASVRIAVSDGVRDDLTRLGVARSSIKVVHNPVRSDIGHRVRPMEWPGGAVRILSVGNLVPAKNQRLLLEAFALVANEVDCSLMICGEGELRGELTQHAVRLGIGDRLLLPGFVDDVASAYASADLFVLSSDREGYPLVLVEALQAGLPVVATDCDFGPREILDGGRIGHLVPVRDARALASAMVEALRSPGDPQLRQQRAAQLNGSGLIDRYEALLLGDSEGEAA